jgi:hypothetical protein
MDLNLGKGTLLDIDEGGLKDRGIIGFVYLAYAVHSLAWIRRRYFEVRAGE